MSGLKQNAILLKVNKTKLKKVLFFFWRCKAVTQSSFWGKLRDANNIKPLNVCKLIFSFIFTWLCISDKSIFGSQLCVNNLITHLLFYIFSTGLFRFSLSFFIFPKRHGFWWKRVGQRTARKKRERERDRDRDRDRKAKSNSISA